MNTLLLSIVLLPFMVEADSLQVSIRFYDFFDHCNREYRIPIPKRYTDSRILEGDWEIIYEYYYDGGAILYITTDGGNSLNEDKIRHLIPSFGQLGCHYITGNISIPFGLKDVPKEAYDDEAVPRLIYYSGKDNKGYWADYQTPHINVGYINASPEQKKLFDRVILYVMETIPNNEVKN